MTTIPKPNPRKKSESYKMLLGDEWLEKSKWKPTLSFALFLIGSYFISSYYLAWIRPKLTSFRQISFYFVSVLTLPALFFVNAFYTYAYLSKTPSLEKYKVTSVAWPWEKNPAEWRRRLPNVVFTYFVNYFVIGSLLIQFSIYMCEPNIDPNDLPSVFELLWQIGLGILSEDFFFYWSHRFLHLPWLYKNIHKKHHEHFNTITLTSIYAHPLELIVGNTFPALSVLYMLKSRMHIVTFSIWLNIRLISTHDGHSGYDMPFAFYKAIPNSTTAVFHVYHHLKNIGNYGSSLRIWDSLFGTSAPWDEEQRVRKQLREKEIDLE